jgi:5-methylcytosine-specific restriction endonuclease McrA
MLTLQVVCIATAVSVLSAGAESREQRSRLVISEFKRQHPCPATNSTHGPCPGWEVDHILPLCDGGKDHVSNLQWLTVEEHKIKSRSDTLACRRKVPAPIHD